MSRLRIIAGLAVALCALAAFAAPALAKEKMVFGQFEATIVGQTISEATPGKLGIYKEGSIDFNGFEAIPPNKEAHKAAKDVAGLNLGGTEFGPRYTEDIVNGKGELEHNAGDIEANKPACKKSKLVGQVTAEHFSELEFELQLKKCISYIQEVGNVNRTFETTSNITLPIVLRSNNSAEIGRRESVLEIPETHLTLKLGLKKCPVIVPTQTIPIKDNGEKLYEEFVEYSNEAEEPEGIEHSKKLKMLYPSGEKNLLDVEFEERFKSIRSYGSNTKPCGSTKGDENAKLVEDPESPFNGMIEFKNGHLFGELEEIEVKNGNLSFNEPA
jgi:hypothetical protein